MRITIGLASKTKQFVSIFIRYFQAAGYDVLLLQSPEGASEALRSRQLQLLVIDSEIMKGAGADWRGTAALAASTSVPVRAAGPREEKNIILKDIDCWATALTTYPMNPGAGREK